jgi:hypothetical protein
MGDWAEQEMDRLPSHLRRIARLAVRACYALRMEEAVVWLERKGGQPAVADIADPRRAGESLAALWQKRVSQASRAEVSPHGALQGQGPGLEANSARHAHPAARANPGASAGSASVPEVMLGADPEFVLAGEDGRILVAGRWLPREGTVGCDRVWVRERWLYPLAELRPLPAAEPEALLRGIRSALARAERMIMGRAASWHAGGLPHPKLPLGGHVHFSGLPCTGELLRVLDNYLALPLMMVEDEASLRRRPGFGFLGDHRFKPHGGFEYRTLPSWLVHPQVAAGVLALAKIIAMHHGMLRLRPLNDVERQRQFYMGDKAALAAEVRRIWDDLVRTPGYARYRRMAEPLRRMSLAAKSWDSGKDLREVWKIGGGPQKSSASVGFMV